MIRFLFPLCIVLFFLSSCRQTNTASQEPELLSIQIIDRNGFAETVSAKDRLVKYQTTDFSEPQPYQKVLRVFKRNIEGQSVSRITSYHSNGLIQQYLEVVDGRAHGCYKEWHPNGRKKLELTVIEGIADLSDTALKSWIFEGKNLVWDEQENLIAEIPYDKGMLDGDSLYYYPEGQLKKKIPYVQDKIHGIVLSYTKEGAILEAISCVNDNLDGPCYAYTEEGSSLYEETFSQGLLLDGIYWNHQGKELSRIQDGTGKRGEYENGILVRLVEYKKGSPEGLVECFNAKGQLFISYSQKNQKKHGEEKEYYPRENENDPPQLKLQVHWQEDVLQGVVKTWFQEGGQESQKELYQNKKNGPAYAWYKRGDLMLVEHYENNLLMSGSYYKKGDKKPVSTITQGKGIATLYDPEGYFLKKISYEKGLPILDDISSP